MTMPAFGNDALDIAIADVESAVGGNFAGAKLHLGKSNIPIARDTSLATLVAQEADFHTYAAKSVTWGAPIYDEAQRVVLQGTTTAFVPTDAVAPNTIFNWWLTDSTSAVLLLAGKWEGNGIPMTDVTSSLLPIIRYYPNSSGFSEVIW